MSIPTSRTRTRPTRRLNAAAVTFLLLAAPLALLLSVSAPVAAGTPVVDFGPDDLRIQTSADDVRIEVTVKNNNDNDRNGDALLIRSFIEVEFIAPQADIRFDIEGGTGSVLDECKTGTWTAAVDNGGTDSKLTFTGGEFGGGITAGEETFPLCLDAGTGLADGEAVGINVRVVYGTTEGLKGIADNVAMKTIANAFSITGDDTSPGLSSAGLFTVDDQDLGTNGIDLDNGDGHLDAIKITFNEAMDEASLSASAGRWQVPGYSVGGLQRDATNPNVAYLLVQKTDGAPDTGMTPTVTYDDTAGANPAMDLAGNLLVGFSNEPTIDRAAPVITQRGVSLGGTTIIVKFSEPVFGQVSGTPPIGVRPVKDSDFDYVDVTGGVDQTLQACSATPGTDGSVSNICHAEGAATVTLTVNNAFVQLDEGDKLCVESDGTSSHVFDAVGNPAPHPSGCAAADTLDLFGIDGDSRDSVVTKDSDGNGYLDAVVVTFTAEPDATNQPVDADWSVEGYDKIDGPGDDPVVLSGSILTIHLKERTDLLGDTGATPTVAYEALGQRMVATGNPTATLRDQEHTAVDKADPVLLHVRGMEGTRFAKAVFSEPVWGNFATSSTEPPGTQSGDLRSQSPPHLTYSGSGNDGPNSILDDSSSSSEIAGITHAPGDSVVVLELSARLDADDLDPLSSNQDSLTPMQNNGCTSNSHNCVYDRVGNKAAQTAVGLTKFNGPAISSLETVDADGDGYLDGVRVVFEGAIDDSESKFLEVEWTVDGYTVTDVNTGTSIGSTTDDDTILIEVAQKQAPQPHNTGAALSVSHQYLGGGIFDANGEALIPFSGSDAKSTTDKARPILVGAHGNPGSDLLRLEFSEPVEGGEVGGLFDIKDIAGYVDDDLAGAGGYLTFDDGTSETDNDGSDREVTLRLNAPLELGDLDGDSIALRADRVKDVDSNPLHADKASVDVTDVDAPGLLSIEVVDSNGNGGIDGLRLAFDEPMGDDNLGESGLSVFLEDANGDLVHDFTIVPDSLVLDAGDARVLQLVLEEQLDGDGNVELNSAEVFLVSYDPENGVLTDASANPLGLVDAMPSQDTMGPRVLSAVTQDLVGSDGYVDAYLVKFNEDIQALADVKGWRVGGKGLTGVEHPYGGTDYSRALFRFAKIGDEPDTALTPQLTYVPPTSGGVVDPVGNPMLALAAADEVEQDGAPPRLWKVEADGGSSVVTARFTEAVDNGANPPGKLNRFSFQYTDAADGGATSILSVDHQAESDQAIITLDAPLTAQDVENDAITILANKAYDAVGLVAPTDTLLSGFTDSGGAPFVVFVETRDDSDGMGGAPDGLLDAIVVQFNEDLDAPQFITDDWPVEGYDVIAVDEDVGTVTLTLDQLSDGGDTGVKPAVSFTGSIAGVKDLAGNAWAGASLPSTTDAAAPVLLSVSGGEGFGFLHLRFSEPVFAEGDGSGDLDPTAFEYIDTIEGARIVEGTQHTAGDALVRLDLDTALTADDIDNGLDSDTAAAVAGRVFGLEGLPASDVAKRVTAFDAPAPSGVAETIDSDKNGHVDAVRVTFDAPINDGSSTFDASHWTIPGRAVSDVVTGGAGLSPSQANDEVVYILISESAQPDTDATFTLDYTPASGGLVGADGAPVAAYDVVQQVADKAGPVVVRATGNPGSEFVTVTFSEAVYADNTATPSSVLTKQLIQYIDNGGGPAPSGLSEANAGDKEVTIEMADVLLFSDLGSDKVSLVASKTWDVVGNSGVAFSRALTDVGAPGIESVETVDDDGDGWIDGLKVTLDESYDPASLSTDGFSLGGAYADVEVLDATAVDAKSFLLAFAELPTVDDAAAGGDTGATPDLDYVASEGSLTDLSAVAMEDFTWSNTLDGAAPAIVEARTVDDGDGVLDAYEVTFSEPVLGGSDHTLWSVGGVTATGTDTAAIALARLTVSLDAAAVKEEGGGVGTGDTPELTYDGDSETPDVTDAAGHALPDVLAAAQVEADGAAPVLVHLSVQPGSKTAKAVFSEGVDSGFGGTPGPLTKGGFVYGNGNGAGATAIDSVSHTAGQAVATLTLDAKVDPSDIGSDSLALASATSAYDAAGLAAGTGPADLVDLTAPSVSAVTTADVDQDGRIDRVLIDFDEAIDTSNLEAADFTVLSYTVEETTSTLGHRLTLQLKEEETRDHDTGVTPQVAYDASKGVSKLALTDVSFNAFDPATTPIPATTDGAAPVLVSAKAVDTDVVQARFSEAVQAEDEQGAAVVLGSTQFNYDDGAGDSGNTISVVSHRLGDRIASIALERDLEAKDRTTDTTSTFQDRLSPVDVFDAAGLPAVAADNTPVHVFGGPMLTAIQTVGDGEVEYLQVLFTLPVDDATVAASITGGQWSTSIGSITGMKTSLETTVPAGDVDDDTVYLQMASGITDTGARPLVSYTGTTVVDDSGEPLQKFSAHQPRDGIVPALVKVETVDDEDLADGADREAGDGFLDALLVTASEAVDDGTLDYGKWTVTLDGKTLAIDAAASAAANAVASQANDDEVLLVLADQGSLDTSKAPAVTYAGGVTDLAGHSLPAFTTPRTSLDAAAPVLVSATSPATGQKQVILTFSEAVKGSGTSNAVAVADLKYTDHATDPFNKGATKIASLTHSGATVTATLDKDFTAADHMVDTVQAKASVVDAAGVSALETPVLLATDVDPPAAVTDLSAGSPSGNSVTLTFTAVADDANHAASGAATSYQIRHHSSAITAANWASATPAAFSATPGAPGAAESVKVTGLATETTYHFALRAVDDAGNVGGVSNSVSATTLADGTPPSGTLAVSSSTHTSGVASPATSAVLTWAGISDAESSITYRYKVSDQATYTVTSADDAVTGTSITLSSLADGSRYVHLAGFSAGGSRQAAPFQVVTDTVAPAKVTDLAADDKGPLSITLTWKAPGDDGSSGTATDYQLYRSESAFTAGGLADVPLVSGVVAPAAAGTAQSFEVTGLEPDTEYHFAIRARDDAGNAGALSSVVVASTEPDTTAPVGELGLRSSSHVAGAKSSLRDLAFGWDAAADAESDVVYRYALVEDDGYALSDADETTDGTSIDFDGVEPGTWTFLVAAESDGGRGATESFQVVLLGLSDEDLEDANKEVVTKVTRKGDTNVVTWTLPAGTPADVEGVQVLRSNSPYRVVATLPADSEEFAQGTFVDDSEDAKATSSYLVTMYYGESDSLGKQPEGQDLLLSEPLTAIGATPAPEASGSVFGHAAFYLGLLAVLAIVGFAIAAVVMHGQRRPQPAREPTSREASA